MRYFPRYSNFGKIDLDKKIFVPEALTNDVTQPTTVMKCHFDQFGIGISRYSRIKSMLITEWNSYQFWYQINHFDTSIDDSN